MKKLILTLVAAMTALGAAAQAPNMTRMISGAATPGTSVKVRLEVERQSVRSGPYARYAQKMLGVIAPLADRTTFVLLGATIDYDAPGHTAAQLAPMASGIEVVGSHVNGGGEFVRVSLDRTSAREKSTEELARDAANMIFQLRGQRLSILTGDAGELYPGGTAAVLSEITRLEDEYLALFLGKQTTMRTVREFDVVPVQGKNDYVVCRFSDADGVGQSGADVVLAVKPEGAARAAAEAPADKRATALWRVADYAACLLRMGEVELAWARVPLFQLGVTVAGATL